MAKQIKLTRGLFATVDDHNFEWLSQWKWFAHGRGTKKDPFYAARTIRLENGKRKDVFMHRVIARTPEEMICDHINRDTLCNMEENLRNVTRSQSVMNRDYPSGSSGHKNIVFYRRVFIVWVHANGKRVYEKRFKTLEEAIVARDEALKKYHGEYAFNAEVKA